MHKSMDELELTMKLATLEHLKNIVSPGFHCNVIQIF